MNSCVHSSYGRIGHFKYIKVGANRDQVSARGYSWIWDKSPTDTTKHEMRALPYASQRAEPRSCQMHIALFSKESLRLPFARVLGYQT